MSPLAQILMTANRQPPAPPQTTVNPTNVAGIYANNDAQNMDAYKAQVGQQNAMYGGLASLGSAGIGALGKSGLGGLSGLGAAAAPDISAGALASLEALGPMAMI
jgi:hypothetical protein